jgi:hypothetical protein
MHRNADEAAANKKKTLVVVHGEGFFLAARV